MLSNGLFCCNFVGATHATRIGQEDHAYFNVVALAHRQLTQS
jgi:hypothetical protein